ncbi:hypothetical protein GH714_016981 [Hevea brasiliensis]|uniref:CBS domain-containing protein n=1 Tax=Hevea brasiliensis TaxID=3981 RepID=A0A6A6LS68_HEVBR|nr:hypothetical protein GH714_016981 [Hevea brasiliensis]
MAVSLLAREVSDLCLGKPALRSLSVSATVGDALSSLRRFGDPYLSVWSCDHHCNASRSKVSDVNECRCIGKVCMVDVICFLCEEDNLKNPGSALQEPVSVILPKVPGLVRHLEQNASLVEAIDLILEGAQNLVIPIHSPFSRKKLTHKPSSNSTLHDNRVQYCWLTQEDIIRYLLNCIDGKLIGEISPYVLNSCNESVAAAIATLSTGDFMAYIDCGDPPEDLIRLVKERLEERNLGEALELLEEESEISASSSDEEFGLGRSGRLGRRSSRVVRNTDAIVCFPWSSLVAVMIQALSHRVSNVWVVEEDGTLVGIVTFAGMMKVFRERLKSMM